LYRYKRTDVIRSQYGVVVEAKIGVKEIFMVQILLAACFVTKIFFFFQGV
jgi:hypothetical protein